MRCPNDSNFTRRNLSGHLQELVTHPYLQGYNLYMPEVVTQRGFAVGSFNQIFFFSP